MVMGGLELHRRRQLDPTKEPSVLDQWVLPSRPAALFSSNPSISSADGDDWERLEDQPQPEGIQNVLYLNDEGEEEEEEEEEGDMEMERGQEGRKVAVRSAA